MVRRLLLNLIFIFFTSLLFAQNNQYKSAEDYFKNVGKIYWHGVYTQGLEVGLGIGEQTRFVSAYGSAYLGEKTFIKVGAIYETGNIRNIDYAAINGDVSANYQLFTVGNIFHLYLTGGATVVYDDLQTDLQRELDYDFEDFDGLNMGVFGGGEAQVFVGKRIALLAFANQRYYFYNDGFGTERYFAGIGMKYAFKK